jgi:outer membrane lipoprotein carrier protein
VFAKPGKMRWTYEEPEPSEVISDGRTLWLYDPAHSEVQRLPVGDGYMSGAAIQFLLGEGDMTREFRIREKACGTEAAELELLPREPASYERLEVVANPATGDLVRTRIVDLLGNVTEVAFFELEVDRDPPAQTFTFEAPEGVRTLDFAPVAP